MVQKSVKPHAVLLVLMLVGGCAGGSAVSPSRSDTLAVCDFDVGDSVFRNEVGAAVPPRGQGVVGNGDDVYRFASIQIETSEDGIVTITSEATGQAETVERCALP
jgi:hypothetical protein